MAAASFQAAWQRVPKPQQVLLRLLGVGLLLWGVGQVTLRPLQRRLRALKAEVAEAEARLLAATAASQQTERMQKAFAPYQPYVKKPAAPEVELAGFMTEVEQAAKDAGIAEPYLKPLKTPEATPQVLSATMEAEASPAQLIALLDTIQRSTRLLRVKELTVRVTEGRTLRSSLVIEKLLLAS